MYCPENILMTTKVLWVTHYAKTDYIHWPGVPLAQKLNPLRYQIGFFKKRHGGFYLKINNKGRWALKLANAIYKTKKRFVRN